MIIEIITLFPESVCPMVNESILARAQRFGIVEFDIIQLRDYAEDKHNTVDDKPFGGGPGMVLKADVVARALDDLRTKRPELEPFVIFTSPQGDTFTQEIAEELSEFERITILCGHYKGVDQRVLDEYVDREISIGDYVLTGGEIPALAISDAIVRLVPGVLGDPESAAGDSFTRGLLDHPHYTQPASWNGVEVPDVLVSGHHANIEQWRSEQAIERTRKRRPDLYEKWLKKKQST
ncbi:tRNA (guanosine(37)-N1)-methyltransferase TrmD [bacterium]|nr:tRNA (guanosine(37)-N1)-methyltransferase TrmD [bacterium]